MKENRVRDELAVGMGPYPAEYFGVCGRASLGPADILAANHSSPLLLVQVKGDKGSPYANFRPADRAELRQAAALAGGEAWLAWRPPRSRTTTWIPAIEWPTTSPVGCETPCGDISPCPCRDRDE